MENSVWFEGMKYGIVFFGLLLAYAEIAKSIKLLRLNKKFPKLTNVTYVWLKFFMGLCGLYWAIYYIRSILDIGLQAHQVWVRGPLMLTIAIFACGALMSLRRPL